MNLPAPAVTIAAADPNGIDRDELQRLWLAVTLAGGAVGLRAPVTLKDTRPLADDVLRRAHTGEVQLIVARLGNGGIVGLVGIYRETAARRQHRATLRRLMVAPAQQGTGIGTALITAAHDHARNLGVELILVEIRDGTGIERFYESLGYRACARIPDGLSFGEDRIDELIYVRDLRDGP